MNEDEMRQKGNEAQAALIAMQATLLGLENEIGDAAYQEIRDRWNELVYTQAAVFQLFVEMFDAITELAK